MMTEQRFTNVGGVEEYVHLIFDNKTAKTLSVNQTVKKLNEQQATINELKAQLREKEEDEKLYANEILELRETNKEHIKFKSLGGDY